MFGLNQNRDMPRFVLKDPEQLEFIPRPQHPDDAGADIRAWIEPKDPSADDCDTYTAVSRYEHVLIAGERFKTSLAYGRIESLPTHEVIMPGEVKIICAGFKIQLPVLDPNGAIVPVYKIVPRSGFAIKHKLTVINSPGIVDASYRGWVGVGLYNQNNIPHIIPHGTRIAQGIYDAVFRQGQWRPEDMLVDELDETVRGEGGFGHTGQ